MPKIGLTLHKEFLELLEGQEIKTEILSTETRGKKYRGNQPRVKMMKRKMGILVNQTTINLHAGKGGVKKKKRKEKGKKTVALKTK